MEIEVITPEMLASKKVVLLADDIGKIVLSFLASKIALQDKRYDFKLNKISITDCVDKKNIKIFMRVLNKFKTPFIIIHDVDPIEFSPDKTGLTEDELKQKELYDENRVIENALDLSYGKIIRIGTGLKSIINITEGRFEKHGIDGAVFFKYNQVDVDGFEPVLKRILDLIIDWDEENSIIEL